MAGSVIAPDAPSSGSPSRSPSGTHPLSDSPPSGPPSSASTPEVLRARLSTGQEVELRPLTDRWFEPLDISPGMQDSAMAFTMNTERVAFVLSGASCFVFTEDDELDCLVSGQERPRSAPLRRTGRDSVPVRNPEAAGQRRAWLAGDRGPRRSAGWMGPIRGHRDGTLPASTGSTGLGSPGAIGWNAGFAGERPAAAARHRRVPHRR